MSSIIPSFDNRLHTSYFLHCLSFSLVICSIPPYILSHGGSHFLLGILASCSTASRLWSENFFTKLSSQCEKQQQLTIILTISCIFNALLICITSPWGLVLNRICYMFFNQNGPLYRDLCRDKSYKEYLFNVFGVLQVLGYCLGAILSGHLITRNDGFFYIGLIATILGMTAAALASQMVPEEKKEPVTMKHVAECYTETLSESKEAIGELVRINPENKRILITQAMLVTCSFTLFTKFVLHLKWYHGLSATAIGYTTAYRHIFTYLANLVMVVHRHYLLSYFKYFEITIVAIGALSASSFFYAFLPFMELYLVAFVPLVMSRAGIDHFFNDIEQFKEFKNIKRDLKLVAGATSVIAPLIVGICCDIFGIVAFWFFLLIPSFIALYYMTMLIFGTEIEMIYTVIMSYLVEFILSYDYVKMKLGIEIEKDSESRKEK